jgi:hypothetical protein
MILLLEWCFPVKPKLYFDYANTIIFVKRYVALKKSSFVSPYISIKQEKEVDNATSYLVCCITLSNIFSCDELYLRTQINKMVKDAVRLITDEYINEAF